MNFRRVINGSVLRALGKNAFLLHPRFSILPIPHRAITHLTEAESLLPTLDKSFHFFPPLKATTRNMSTCSTERSVVMSTFIKVKE